MMLFVIVTGFSVGLSGRIAFRCSSQARASSTIARVSSSAAPGTASASSHREAPGISGQPQYDNTDLYAFNSPDKPGSVTLIANWYPFEEPAGGPNFYPWATDAHHDINIDNNGDAKPDIIYRWDFKTSRTPGAKDSFSGNGTFLTNNGQVTTLKDENLLLRQTYDLTRIEGKRDQLVGRIQERYGIARDEADRQISDWERLH